MKRLSLILAFFFLLSVLVSCETAPRTLTMTLNPGIDTVDQNTSYQDSGAIARFGDRVLDVTVIENTVDITTLGTYQIMYQATYGTETVTASRIVTVIDAMPPVLTLQPGIDTIIQGQTWMDAGVDVVDNSGHQLVVTVTGSVDTHVVGQYTITYEVVDPSGNSASISRTVFVIEPS